MTVTLRVANANDLPFLRTMLYQAIYVPAGEPPPALTVIDLPEIAQYVTDFGKHGGDMGYIALDAEIPVGAAWLRLITGYGYVDGNTPELTIAVSPAHRGQGIGEQLLQILFESIRPHYKQVCLSVTWENPARRLYERFGFYTVKLEDGTATMVKQVSP